MSIVTHARRDSAGTESRATTARRARRTTGRLLGSLAAMAAAIGLAIAAPLSASAITSISVSPNSGPAAGFTTSVTVNGTEIGHTYRVGLCSDANVGTPAIAPACQYVGSQFSGTGGSVTVSGAVQRVLTNAHFGAIPGQPATFNCGTTLCQIVVTDNHSSGSFPTVTAPITFS